MMTKQVDSDLLQRAQLMAHKEAAADSNDDVADLSPQALRDVLQNLRLLEIELEMKNHELRRTQVERDMAEARYFDFYDRAPAGYVTASKQGLILRSNLTAAAMVGVDRSQLAGQAFSRFIERNDQNVYNLLRKRVFETSTSQSCELHMLKHDGSEVFARMDAIAARGDDGAPVMRMVLIDITAHRQDEADLRIAAAAFETQEAIAVMNSERLILRVNQAFADITGYSKQELLGKTSKILRSKRQSVSFFEDIWRRTLNEGLEQGGRWLLRKNGEDFFAHGTTTAVKDQQGQTTHYVLTFSDQTLTQQQEQLRRQHEAAHRDALVGEVHHRIKNSLQGIGGLLRQFASQKPEIAEQMQLVAGHLNGISVIYGLQGRHEKSEVRLCELTREIAQATTAIWQTEITVETPPDWVFRVVSEKEAVSMALVLNELVVNAVKHGGKAQGHVSITLRQGLGIEGAELSILNAGYLRNNKDRPAGRHHGLQLIESLRPREGMTVTRTQRGDQVHTLVQLTAPVISLYAKN